MARRATRTGDESPIPWDEYARKFRTAARFARHDEQYVTRCLKYARRLYQRQLPIIYDQEHLSTLVGYSTDYLRAASNQPELFYRRFAIPKKPTGVRAIAEPLPSLKEIQRWILDNLIYVLEPTRYAKAFFPGRSIMENARFHRGQPVVLSLDIADFFGSLRENKVYRLYRRLGYAEGVAVMLTKLCTLDGALPQGAPTSPAISNLLCTRIDNRIGGFAKKHGLRYTRYADDITISGELSAGDVIGFVGRVLADEGLSIKEQKTRAMHRHQRQEVTGIVVNRTLQAPHEIRDRIRTSLYFIKKYGYESHASRLTETRRHHDKHLMGLCGFVLSINPSDRHAKELLELLGTQTDTDIPRSG